MESYDAGLQFIENLGRARRKVNSLSRRHYELTELQHKDPDNETYKKELKEVEQELILYRNEEQVQKEALFALENSMDPDFYKLLLQNLGATLASTASFPHIADSQNNEYNFQKAIESTTNAIRIKEYELLTLPEDDYNRRKVVQAELNYYYNDMTKSPISKSRLESIKKEQQALKGRGI